MHVKVDRDRCIGTGSCVAYAGSVFQLDDENKSIILDEHDADDESLMLAAQGCPVHAITLTDESGKQVFPLTN